MVKPSVRCKFSSISCQNLPKWFTVSGRGPALLIKRACCVLSVIDGAWFELSLLIKIICGLHVMKNYGGQRRTWLHSYIHAAEARETHLCCSSNSRRQRTSITLICPLTRHDPVNTIFFTLNSNQHHPPPPIMPFPTNFTNTWVTEIIFMGAHHWRYILN